MATDDETETKIIDFGNGIVRETALSVFIEKAEADPDAIVYDANDGNAPPLSLEKRAA